MITTQMLIQVGVTVGCAIVGAIVGGAIGHGFGMLFTPNARTRAEVDWMARTIGVPTPPPPSSEEMGMMFGHSGAVLGLIVGGVIGWGIGGLVVKPRKDLPDNAQPAVRQLINGSEGAVRCRRLVFREAALGGERPS